MRGKYDIVYMVKDSAPNEELRYSLRSIEKNWGPHGNVWIFGGCPDGIAPDRFVPVEMILPGKWENTHRLMKIICQTADISEDFWFFNDDFFVMRPASEDMPQMYNGTIPEVIRAVESPDAGVRYWTDQLHILDDLFRREGMSCLNYEVHKPMLINRRKMLDVMDRYRTILFTRSLYGNVFHIGGEDGGDVLVKYAYGNIDWVLDQSFVSTTEDSFAKGEIGERIRGRFPQPCAWEVQT
jgi:hypothetical protein